MFLIEHGILEIYGSVINHKVQGQRINEQENSLREGIRFLKIGIHESSLDRTRTVEFCDIKDPWNFKILGLPRINLGVRPLHTVFI